MRASIEASKMMNSDQTQTSRVTVTEVDTHIRVPEQLEYIAANTLSSSLLHIWHIIQSLDNLLTRCVNT